MTPGFVKAVIALGGLASFSVFIPLMVGWRRRGHSSL
jgi:hypothetical protein